jgi:hypothetical protein
MASHFEDSCEMQTFGPHRPSSFFEEFYPVSTGNFLRRARRLRCLRLSFCLGMVSLALPVDLPTLLVSECRARAVFFATCSSFFASFVVDLDSLVAGDLRHEFA